MECQSGRNNGHRADNVVPEVAEGNDIRGVEVMAEEHDELAQNTGHQNGLPSHLFDEQGDQEDSQDGAIE